MVRDDRDALCPHRLLLGSGALHSVSAARTLARRNDVRLASGAVSPLDALVDDARCAGVFGRDGDRGADGRPVVAGLTGRYLSGPAEIHVRATRVPSSPRLKRNAPFVVERFISSTFFSIPASISCTSRPSLSSSASRRSKSTPRRRSMSRAVA